MQRKVVKRKDGCKSVESFKAVIAEINKIPSQNRPVKCGNCGKCDFRAICGKSTGSEITHLPPSNDDTRKQIVPTRKIGRQTINKQPIRCKRTGEEGMVLSEVIELQKEQFAALGGKNKELVMKFIRLGDIKVV